MTDERNYFINGPWTGAAIKPSAPLPYRIQRRRSWAKITFCILAVLVVIGCGLAGFNHV